jgi:PIN domain nuclease of toxin-antitoxin system
MKLLLDAHALIWSADRPAQIPAAAMAALSDPSCDLLVSAATIWEMAIKHSLGKLPLSLPYRQWMETALADLGLALLPITLDHAERQCALPFHHRDPFDRLLAAQSLVEDLYLVSGDTIFDSYGVKRIWESTPFDGHQPS